MTQLSLAEQMARLRARYPTPALDVVREESERETAEHVEVERAFVIEAPKRQSFLITAPAQTAAAGIDANPGFGYLAGRFVEADRPNRNSAYWSSEDLELGERTVAGGPLNWLHEERNIVGTLLHSEFVQEARHLQAAGVEVGNHITAVAAVWKYLFGEQYAVIQKASADRQLFYSMECVSKSVECLDTPGRPGCGEQFQYATFMNDRDRVCAHLREGSSVRRFAEPIFLGGAVIVPPVRPGWAGAEASVVREASAVAEKHEFATLDRPEAEAMVQQLLAWAGSTR